MADAVISDADRASSNPSENYFDYTDMKNRYMEQVKMYYANRKLPVITPYTREVVDRIKNLINEKQLLLEAGHPSDHAKYKVAHKYEVIEQNGEEILICKRILANDPIVQVVPAEDCFDILVNAHLETKHGGKDKILSAVKKSNYIVPKTSIDFLLVVCKICNLNGRTKRRADERVPRIFNSRGQISLVDMTEQPDNEFKHILCYIDRFTSYILLRPLVTDSVQETAIELLKIFFDFGPPEKLETYNRPFFMKVMSLINTAHSEFNISLVLPVKTPVFTPMDVKEMIRDWKIKTGSNNWAMGCYAVQWNNNIERTPNKAPPYSAVFKRATITIPREDKQQPQEKSGEDVLNLENGFNQLNFLPISDPDCEEIFIVDEDDVLSEDDEDCLITITDPSDEPLPILPVTTNNLPNKELNKRPNILTKRPVKGSSHTNMDNTKNQFIVSAPSKNVSTEITSKESNKESKELSNKDVPKPVNKRCHVCKTEIKKAYSCTECNKKVHLFCSDRLLQPDISPEVLTVTCTSCTLTNRSEVKKRKIDDIDSDKTSVINIKD